MPFDPMRDVPETEEQVLQTLRHNRDPTLATSLIGIFQCQLAMGKNLLEAYKLALLAHIEACQSTTKEGG